MALTTVDHSALKVNQTGIVATVLVAFIGSYFYRPLLVLIPLLAVVLLLGTFAPQLARVQGGARTQLLNMLVILTDVYVWKLLRRDMALGRPAAEATIRKMITGVLEKERADGTDTVAELVGRRQPAA